MKNVSDNHLSMKNLRMIQSDGDSIHYNISGTTHCFSIFLPRLKCLYFAVSLSYHFHSNKSFFGPSSSIPRDRFLAIFFNDLDFLIRPWFLLVSGITNRKYFWGIWMQMKNIKDICYWNVTPHSIITL